MCSTSLPLLESEADNVSEHAESYSPQRQLRTLIFYLLYAMDAHDYDASLASIIDLFNRGFEANIELDGEIAHQAQAIIDGREELDTTIKPLLANWRLERIGLCTRLILRLSAWELLHTATAPKIIINEAIELAKCFSEQGAYKFVNGVLDELLKRLEAQQPERQSEAAE